jgi:multidrug efflux pump subunit AcrA (membrane-fusion protein)
MKPSKYMTKAIMLLLFFAAAAYFGVYAYHAFLGSYETASIYEYTGENAMEAEGYLIRQEQPLQDGGSLEEIVVSEGENVAAGDVVARVYSTQDALNQHQELERMQSQLNRLEYMRQRGADESDAMKLNQEIVDAMTGLRGSIGRNDFGQLHHQTQELEELVFRRDYTYSTGSALTAQIESLESQVEQLEKDTESATSTVYSPVAGIYSAMVDGYEDSFDLDELENLTPERLREYASNHAKPSGRELGKVVTSFRWYYAAIMDQAIVKQISSSSQLTVNFEGSAGPLPMKLYFISAPDEDGKVVVVLTSQRDISAIAALRQQNVEVSYGSFTGLRIPFRALRADQETGQLGVYRVTGTQAEWVPVDLLYSGSDYYLVRSHTEGELSQLEKAKLLRAGDEVLVRGKNIHDGQVIE